MDNVQQKQHFESWESFWGRPGNGAPRDSVQKENLMKMLHYADTEVKNVSDRLGSIGRIIFIQLRETIKQLLNFLSCLKREGVSGTAKLFIEEKYGYVVFFCKKSMF